VGRREVANKPRGSAKEGRGGKNRSPSEGGGNERKRISCLSRKREGEIPFSGKGRRFQWERYFHLELKREKKGDLLLKIKGGGGRMTYGKLFPRGKPFSYAGKMEGCEGVLNKPSSQEETAYLNPNKRKEKEEGGGWKEGLGRRRG